MQVLAARYDAMDTITSVWVSWYWEFLRFLGVYAYVATPPRTKGRACDGTRKVFLGEFFRSNIDIVGPGTGTPLSA